MKIFIASLIAMSMNTLFAKSNLENAPIEWLIATSLEKKLFLDHDHQHGEKNGHNHDSDELISKVLSSIYYDRKTDEMILTSTKELYNLRQELIEFLSHSNQKNKRIDHKYSAWARETKSLNEVKLFRTKKKISGHYYFNHIHTDISQDNSSFKKLKMTPKETFRELEKFLKRRNTSGVAAFTDHGTDLAFGKVKSINNENLNVLRSVEWGGGRHMGLIGIQENWNLLPRGRDFNGEESVKQSRSSRGFRIINHPNRNDPFLFSRWGDADGVEVWNTIVESSPFNWLNLKVMDNRGALKQWSDALATGKHYTAVAGSDFHFAIPCLKERGLIYPVNFVPESSRSDIQNNLFKGRSSILTRPTAPKLTLQARRKGDQTWSHMGDTLVGNNKVEINLFADFSDTNKKIGGVCYNTIRTFHKILTFWKKRFWEARFYNKKGELIAKRSLNPKKFNSKKHFRATFEIEVEQKDLVRAELWSINRKMKSIDLLGMTNPIYFR